MLDSNFQVWLKCLSMSKIEKRQLTGGNQEDVAGEWLQAKFTSYRADGGRGNFHVDPLWVHEIKTAVRFH